MQKSKTRERITEITPKKKNIEQQEKGRRKKGTKDGMKAISAAGIEDSVLLRVRQDQGEGQVCINSQHQY